MVHTTLSASGAHAVIGHSFLICAALEIKSIKQKKKKKKN